ncbi:MAG: flagellar basal body rod protein FlgC [Planctomycetota bacterium]
MGIESSFTGFETSVAGMLAERRRMDVISSNIANADTIGPDGPYVRKAVLFEEILGNEFEAAGSAVDSAGRGVAVTNVVEDTVTPHTRVFMPEHPFADEQGFVRRPNVDLTFEMVDMAAARNAYSMNLAAFRVFRQMARETIQNLRSS